MCLWNTDAPAATKSKYGKNLQVLHFDPAPPPGVCDVSEVWEPMDELTVQVWLVYYHQNFKYCTLFVSGTELRTDGQTNRRTDGQTDDPITSNPPADLSGRGHKNTYHQ